MIHWFEVFEESWLWPSLLNRPHSDLAISSSLSCRKSCGLYGRKYDNSLLAEYRKITRWNTDIFVEPIEVEGDQGIQIASVRRPSVRDADKNLNNFAATCPFRAKLGWELHLENLHDMMRSKVKWGQMWNFTRKTLWQLITSQPYACL